MRFKVPFLPGGNVVRLPTASQLRDTDILPEPPLMERLKSAGPGELVEVSKGEFDQIRYAQPQRVPQVPVTRPPERYNCFVIRQYGTSERVPDKLFISGRVYHLSHARFEGVWDGYTPRFIISCKFSLERKPKDATRRRTK